MMNSTSPLTTKVLLTALFVLLSINVNEAKAQVAYSQGSPGVYGRTSMRTGSYQQRPVTTYTNNQQIRSLPRTNMNVNAIASGPRGRNGLPPTSLDSFVNNAGAYADAIYGDEGFHLPPFFEFTKAHRINRGIVGGRDEGITTGHGSYMPDAWGGDEFVDGPEWSQSGNNNGMPMHWTGVGNQPYIDRGPERTPGLYQFTFTSDGVQDLGVDAQPARTERATRSRRIDQMYGGWHFN